MTIFTVNVLLAIVDEVEATVSLPTSAPLASNALIHVLVKVALESSTHWLVPGLRTKNFAVKPQSPIVSAAQ
jgi:hypothetical protein